ncbi:MAG: DPP IV N-terminal domain-containing protein [Verrucomicrobiales bacterium]
MMKYSLLAATLAIAVAGARADTYNEDARRATELRKLSSGKVLNNDLDVHWLEGETHLWYRRQLSSGGHEIILVDTETGQAAPAFDHQKLAAGLELDPGKLDVRAIGLGEGENQLVLNLGERGHLLNLEDYSLSDHKPLAVAKRKNQRDRRSRNRGQRFPGAEEKSPDGKFSLSLRDHNLFLRSAEGENETQLTTDGTAGHAYQGRGRWSPDSKYCVVMRTREAQKHPVHMVESSPEDQLQPKLHTHDYLKPGDQIAQPMPHLFDMQSGKEIPLDPALFDNPWSLQSLHWAADPSEFRFVYNQRGHQVMRVIGIDPATGKSRAIIDEESDTFIDYSQKQVVRFLMETNEILWSSERDGWHHLYLYDAKTGELKNQITSGEWIVRSVDQIDSEGRQVTFRAMGIHPGQDPYHQHFARINFDGSGLVHLSEEDGTHRLTPSPSGRFYIDRYSRVDLPPVHELRRKADGRLVSQLEEADISLLEAIDGWRPPQRFVAKGRDGKTDIYGIIIRPSDFEAGKKYPVIEKIYAGPHGHFVPKEFSTFLHAQTVAEHGFILVQIDGMGTNFRSKAFHDVCWQNLMDSGFPDRIAWLRAAAAEHPELDLARVGIFGGSAGGQSTLAGMLNFPDFYTVGVSDCGCHDNRMDKIWWNEAWMGWPIGDHYAANSNVTHAHKLRGKLLLTVGELDRNVDPASTMQVVDALIRADRDFDMIVVPGAGHGIGESPYMSRRRTQYFIDHLK